MKKELRIGFLTAQDPRNKKSWSGLHFHMLSSLEKEFKEVHVLGPIHQNKQVKKILFWSNKIHCKLFSGKYNPNHSFILSFYYSFKFKKKIKNLDLDVIFAPAASTEIAFLTTKIPVCYLSDTSFSQISNYYPIYSNLSNFSYRESNSIERQAIVRSKTQIYSSSWAANHVIENYPTNPRNVFIVKFGPNLQKIPVCTSIQKDYSNTINFLFVGVDWYRKGGDLVMETFDKLVTAGYDITLTICGCEPPLSTDVSRISIAGTLDKNKKEDSDKLAEIFKEAHILFLPTRADCTPVVFSEANAYGIPVITTSTGGIPSIIEEGINGYTLPLNSDSHDYEKIIKKLLDNRLLLKSLAASSRKKYEEELNWNVWINKIKEILLLTAFTS